MIGISVILITRNEVENIRECLESVQWADEIIVVDAESEDETAEIAREYTAHVFIRPWEGFSRAKQFALDKCNNEWVLWIDSDERVTENLAREMRNAIRTERYVAYRMPRIAYFLGRWIRHSGWYPGHVLRLFRRDRARFNDLKVHEGVEIDGPVGMLQNDLLHYTDRRISHYFNKFNNYTTLAAEELNDRGVRFRLADLVFRPPLLFLKMYLLRLGFLDGLQGFILATFSASYVLAKYAKLWELQHASSDEKELAAR